ncbi:hypothetical protein WJU23_19690 [Prosthecobacter sp. SYSU 5D2]|uniref:hypothetical protein n=1 Tax=Prosthecobacter sp. SYSU 5D2 TaxID=3134134 RepID=UPI0031FECF5D
MNDPATSSSDRTLSGLGVPLPDALILPGNPLVPASEDLFTSPPAPVSSAQDSTALLPDPAGIKTGAEFGLSRFCEQAFINPESARTGSQAILTAFDDSGLWLASLVQPSHLVAELRQQCCLLTRVVITQWTRQGETQKLVRLAEALLEAQPPVLSHEAGQIMALLASLLGVLRPGPAPRWLAACRPLLRDSVDPHLLREAAQWVNIGQMLASLPQEDRHFWNRRLRDPEQDWEWDSPEALDALRRLSPLLHGDAETLLLFQATVPRCWWELWSGQRQILLESAGSRAAISGKPSPITTFALGLGLGVLCMMLAGWWAASWSPGILPASAYAVTASASDDRPSPSFAFHAVEAPNPVLESPPASAAPLPSKPVITKTKAKELPPLSPAMQARRDAAAKIGATMPELQRLHSLVRTGTEREATPHIQGRTMMAAQGSKEHRALLRWLLLDPPLDPVVREQAGKAAVRVLNAQEMYDTLKLCLHPASPNLKEARECAELLLALSGEGLDATQRQNLVTAASVK